MWNSGLVRMGTSYEEMLLRVIEHLGIYNYDRVILTNFEGYKLEQEQEPLRQFSPEIYDYMYGWERDEVKDWNIDYVDGGSHSEVVLVYDWMYELDGEIHICGAFDGECIQDLEFALDGAGKRYTRLNHLIV